MKITVDVQVKVCYSEPFVEQQAADLVRQTGVDEVNPNLEQDLLKAQLGDFVLIGYKIT